MKHLIDAVNKLLESLNEDEDGPEMETLEYVRDYLIPEFYPLDEIEVRKDFQKEIDKFKLGLELLEGEIILLEERVEEGDNWKE